MRELLLILISFLFGLFIGFKSFDKPNKTEYYKDFLNWYEREKKQ